MRARRPWRVLLVVFVTTFLVAGGSATAGAVWTAQNVNLAGSATPATASVTLNGTAALATTYKFVGAGTASTPVIKPLSLANTGSTPLALSLTAATSSSTPATLGAAIRVSTWAGSAGACSATVPAAPTAMVGTLAALPAMPPGATTAAVGQTVTLCVATLLTTPIRSHQGETASAVFTLKGTVGANWAAQSTAAAFVQNVYRINPPASASCVSTGGLGGNAVITFARVPEAANYTVTRTTDGVNFTFITTVAQTASANPTVTIGALQVGLIADSDFTIGIAANDATSGASGWNTTSTPVTSVVRYSTLGTVLAVWCVP